MSVTGTCPQSAKFLSLRLNWTHHDLRPMIPNRGCHLLQEAFLLSLSLTHTHTRKSMDLSISHQPFKDSLRPMTCLILIFSVPALSTRPSKHSGHAEWRHKKLKLFPKENDWQGGNHAWWDRSWGAPRTSQTNKGNAVENDTTNPRKWRKWPTGRDRSLKEREDKISRGGLIPLEWMNPSGWDWSTQGQAVWKN